MNNPSAANHLNTVAHDYLQSKVKKGVKDRGKQIGEPNNI